MMESLSMTSLKKQLLHFAKKRKKDIPTEQEMKDVFDAIDADKSGTIDREEFENFKKKDKAGKIDGPWWVYYEKKEQRFTFTKHKKGKGAFIDDFWVSTEDDFGEIAKW